MEVSYHLKSTNLKQWKKAISKDLVTPTSLYIYANYLRTCVHIHYTAPYAAFFITKLPRMSVYTLTKQVVRMYFRKIYLH